MTEAIRKVFSLVEPSEKTAVVLEGKKLISSSVKGPDGFPPFPNFPRRHTTLLPTSPQTLIRKCFQHYKDRSFLHPSRSSLISKGGDIVAFLPPLLFFTPAEWRKSLGLSLCAEAEAGWNVCPGCVFLQWTRAEMSLFTGLRRTKHI